VAEIPLFEPACLWFTLLFTLLFLFVFLAFHAFGRVIQERQFHEADNK